MRESGTAGIKKKKKHTFGVSPILVVRMELKSHASTIIALIHHNVHRKTKLMRTALPAKDILLIVSVRGTS